MTCQGPITFPFYVIVREERRSKSRTAIISELFSKENFVAPKTEESSFRFCHVRLNLYWARKSANT